MIWRRAKRIGKSELQKLKTKTDHMLISKLI